MAQEPKGVDLCAFCKLQEDGNSGVSGYVTFTQSSEGGPTTICYNITGLTEGNHGFHVHEFGDLSQGCKSAGGHYNPFKKEHGGPLDDNRHVGDLGNIKSNNNGIAKGIFDDKLVQLLGNTSIIGRAIVVHKDEDDLGRGGHNDSKTTGHAGARLACGFIVISRNLPNEMINTINELKKNDNNNNKVNVKGGAKKENDLAPIQAICDLVKDQIKEKAGINDEPKSFQAIEALSQVVAGTNYFVKIKIDDGKYIHARIWRKLDQTSHVTKVLTGQSENDELKYF